MNIHREGNYLIGSDLQGRLQVGIESDHLVDCIEEAKRRQAAGVFGTPHFGFREDNLDFLAGLPHIDRVWFWDIALRNIDGLYALTRLRHFGVHPKRQAIDFSRLRTLEEVVWHYYPKDTGMADLEELRTLHVWHYKPKHHSFEGLDLPGTIEELEILWANPRTLAGLPKLPRVKRLGIHRCRNLETIAELPRIAPNVEHLVVTNCGRVADGEAVVRLLPKLRHAFVRDAVLVSR